MPTRYTESACPDTSPGSCRSGARNSSPSGPADRTPPATLRSEEHTSELHQPCNLVCRLPLEKKKATYTRYWSFSWRSRRCSARRTMPSACPDPLLHRLFFFNDTATTEIYSLSLHDALPI